MVSKTRNLVPTFTKKFCIKFTQAFCKLDHFSLVGKVMYNYETVQLTRKSEQIYRKKVLLDWPQIRLF
jgi:hypothetical protein